jgi:hypothetical protein
VLAALAGWRGHVLAARAFAGLGLAALAAAWLAPARLGPVYRAWMAIASAMSRITTPLFLGLVYFTVLTPVGLLRRLAGRSPLMRPRSTGSLWVVRAAEARRRTDMEHQF